jgi:hypothetical protein
VLVGTTPAVSQWCAMYTNPAGRLMTVVLVS